MGALGAGAPLFSDNYSARLNFIHTDHAALAYRSIEPPLPNHLPTPLYFLSFECSELEGKYSLIVSVYACMHCVWEIAVCCHSGDVGLFVYVACMDGLAQQVDALSSSHSLGDSYSQCRAVFPRYVHGCYISVHLLPHVCFV